MPIVKKLVFALPFLLALFGTYQYLGVLLQNPYLIFDFNVATLIQLTVFLLLLLFSGLFFVVFSTLAQDLKITLPAAFAGTFLALLILPMPSALVITLGSILILTLTLLALNKKLSTYLTFQPTALLVPTVRQLVPLLLLVFSLAFYLAVDTKIKTEGFQIPDSVLDPVIAMTLSQQAPIETETQPTKKSSLPQLTPEQIQLLKQNPQMLKQYGLDPSVLDQVNTNPPAGGPQTLQTSLIKTEVKKQVNALIQPQIQLLPTILAALFFLTLKFGLSILSMVLSPLLWLIFLILEKTGFTQYTKEMREVKKLVV